MIAAPVLPAQSTTLVTDPRLSFVFGRAGGAGAHASFAPQVFFAAARTRVAVVRRGGKLTRLCFFGVASTASAWVYVPREPFALSSVLRAAS